MEKAKTPYDISKEKYNTIFSEEEKAAAFDKIAEMYYMCNFGSTLKADIDLFMFSEYISKCITAEQPYNEFEISKNLGIVQSRVRTLKEKSELKYPLVSGNWKLLLAKSLKNAKYDEQNHQVKILIHDVAVQNEFRNYMEINKWYDEYSLNKRLSVIPLKGFVDIFKNDIDFEDAVQKNIKAICQNAPEDILTEIKDMLKEGTEEELKTIFGKASKKTIKWLLVQLKNNSGDNAMAKTLLDGIITLLSEGE